MNDYKIGDLVEMKKAHPCGSKVWVIYRVGADMGIRCTGCNRRVMLTFSKFQKSVNSVISDQSKESQG